MDKEPNKDDGNSMLVLKKPYHVPRLTEYGHISQLTAGTTGSNMDKGHLANAHGQG